MKTPLILFFSVPLISSLLAPVINGQLFPLRALLKGAKAANGGLFGGRNGLFGPRRPPGPLGHFGHHGHQGDYAPSSSNLVANLIGSDRLFGSLLGAAGLGGGGGGSGGSSGPLGLFGGGRNHLEPLLSQLQGANYSPSPVSGAFGPASAYTHQHHHQLSGFRAPCPHAQLRRPPSFPVGRCPHRRPQCPFEATTDEDGGSEETMEEERQASASGSSGSRTVRTCSGARQRPRTKSEAYYDGKSGSELREREAKPKSKKTNQKSIKKAAPARVGSAAPPSSSRTVVTTSLPNEAQPNVPVVYTFFPVLRR